MERLLTVEQAGELLGTNGPRFPRRLIAERRIRFVKLGRHVRIPESAVREFVDADTVEPIVRDRLAEYVGSTDDSLVFVTPEGNELRRNNWRRDVRCQEKRTAAGLPDDFHFHDLRRTGNHLASMSGASTRELMHRMGHGTVRAALIYQHATSDRDRQIAEALSALVADQRKADEEKNGDDDDPDDGAAGVLAPTG